MGSTLPRSDRKRPETNTPGVSGPQLSIDFSPGLLEQFPSWQDCIRESVYGCGRAFKAVAADLDMSVSDLSRKLANAPGDPAHFPLDRLPELIAATGDKRPIDWLVLKFKQDTTMQKRQAIAQLASLTPLIERLLRTAEAGS